VDALAVSVSAGGAPESQSRVPLSALPGSLELMQGRLVPYEREERSGVQSCPGKQPCIRDLNASARQPRALCMREVGCQPVPCSQVVPAVRTLTSLCTVRMAAPYAVPAWGGWLPAQQHGGANCRADARFSGTTP
jgi:hypothetical protein